LIDSIHNDSMLSISIRSNFEESRFASGKDGAPMSMNDLYSNPGHLIRRAHQIAVALFMEQCERFDLTPVQYASLVAIRENPGVDATRLSALIAFDRSTLGSVLERLEAKKLVARSASPDDKRIKLLRLTPAGAALLRAVVPAVAKSQARLLEPLPPRDRTALMALLNELVKLNNDASRAPLRMVGEQA
jgi:MarR family transcriptional regulator, lower aerobic nicotinate degradation pathway regulator